jgi:hypothetical protein
VRAASRTVFFQKTWEGDSMKAMELKSRWKQAAGAAIAMPALAMTVACSGAAQVPAVTAQQPPTAPPGAPVVVSCEPHQRTLVRQAMVNGAAVSQVECVAAATVASAQPATYAPVATPARRVAQPAYDDLPDAQVIRPVSTTARPVRTSQVIYDERPVKRTRSVKKSAVIIGSSAGAGAGVGAAIGGKKGALIGAAIGGGGAAIWDQVTRRK